jgi:hypothetical protein
MNTREAKEYRAARVEDWIKRAGANINSPNDLLAALFVAADDDWEQRNQGRDMEPRDART